ncbi:chemotaxis protein CheA, partial [Burkholderia sp. Ac-20384]|nr:chemotaxis protein CheA [Burkholderia sp. Ac-20384]
LRQAAPEAAQPAVAAAPADMPTADAKVPEEAAAQPADMPALSDPAQGLPPASVDQQAAPAAPIVPAPAVISTSTSS